MMLLRWLMTPLLITAAFALPALAGSGRQTPYNFTKASDIIGEDVKDINGEDIGELDDLLIDRNGRVMFGLVDGDHYVPVPWPAFQKNSDGDLTLGVKEDELATAPSLRNDDDWPKLNDPAFAGAVYDFYGVEPNMRTARTERGGDLLHKNIRGEVLTLSDDLVVIKDKLGREIALRYDDSTKMPRRLMEGDRVTARITPDRYAEVIEKLR